MAPADTPADLMRVPLPVTVFDGRSNLYFTVYRQSSSLYQAEFRVDSHGKELFRHVEKLVYSIGAGAVGYTYMVQRGQYLFEAPLSFYSKRETWDLSPGYNLQDPGFSRPIATLCIECHSGRPLPASPRASPGALFVSFKGADPPFAEFSIGCENCHGPGQLHVEERLKGLPLAGDDDSSIVNPGKLPRGLSNNICMNCHQIGDIRVLKPGRGPFDFRPGTPLGETVAILQKPLDPASPPPSPLLDHYLGMTLSKCYMESGGRMSCITCHNPHTEPSREEMAASVRNKCLSCHSDNSCKLPLSQRHANSVPDNCAGCHMHEGAVAIVPHTTLTSHRIVIDESEPYPNAAFHSTNPALPDLIYLDAVPGGHDVSLSPETLLAIYAQAVNKDPETFRRRYLSVLDQAENSAPDNVFVLSELAARALWEGTEGGRAKATQYLERALQLGSDDPQDYLRLAELLAHADRLPESIEVLKRGVRLSPYDRLFYEIWVADDMSMGKFQEAAQAAGQGLQLFPEDSIIRSLLRAPISDATSH